MESAERGPGGVGGVGGGKGTDGFSTITIKANTTKANINEVALNCSFFFESVQLA